MNKSGKNKKSLTSYSLLMKEWNHAKNEGINPADYSYGSELLVWWKCSKCLCEYQMPIYYRTSKKCGCRNCRSLLVKNPELSLEWNYKKNVRILPQDVYAMGTDRVWWTCKLCGHEWRAQVCQRSGARKNGCPKCKRKRANNLNSLAAINPELSKEWNYKRNYGLTPSDFTANSHKKVWWKCPTCSYEWQEVINWRNQLNNKCNRCRSLAVKNPELAREWSYTKNKNLTPFDVSFCSHRRLWWECLQCGYKWQATPLKRNEGLHNCPSCTKIILKNNIVCDSFPEAYVCLGLMASKKKFCHNKKYGGLLGEKRYDFYLPKENKYIEVTSFNKNNCITSWISYLRNIVLKKRYVENVIGASFKFIQLFLTSSQRNFVKRNMKNY